jgi:hypothetical protein
VRSPHLLRVEEGPGNFDRLLAAIWALDLRAGWLELEGPVEPVPASLEAAADLGVLRAVATSAARTVTVKPRRGAPVLRDLVREHFAGCALVFVYAGTGEAPDLPVLRRDGEAWRVSPATSGVELPLSTEQVAARLRKPRPWEP